MVALDENSTVQGDQTYPADCDHSQTDVHTGVVERLREVMAPLTPFDRLVQLRSAVPGRIVFTTSFGLEDQAIFHLLHGLDIDVVTLDTGRLFSETYALWAETERHYGRRIRALYPREDALEALIEKQGIDGFYDSVDARHACCHVRKVEPLARALNDAKAWVTGLREDQSYYRADGGLICADGERGLLKASPLFDWTRDAVLAFAHENNVPLNPLHERGFASIGCAPCTRAIRPGEPERAGRWWWEESDKRECGLHTREPGGASATS